MAVRFLDSAPSVTGSSMPLVFWYENDRRKLTWVPSPLRLPAATSSG